LAGANPAYGLKRSGFPLEETRVFEVRNIPHIIKSRG
jgi:hypothetical protein